MEEFFILKRRACFSILCVFSHVSDVPRECYSVGWSIILVQTEMPQQLWNGLQKHFVQTFIVRRA